MARILNDPTARCQWVGRFGRYLSRRIRGLFSVQRSFINIHIVYFLFLSFSGAFLLYIFESHRSMPFLDAAFIAFSCTCVTGLSTVDITLFSTASLVTCVFLVAMGSSTLFSALPIIFRRYFIRRFYDRIGRRVEGDAQSPKIVIDGSAEDPKEVFKIAGNSMRPSVDISRPAPKKTAAKEVDPGTLKDNLEYQAQFALFWVIISYYLVFQFLGFVILYIYGTFGTTARARLDAAGIHPAWFGLFHSVSAYNNAGFALFSDNMVSWRSDPVVMLTLSCLIALGNTAFAVVLRGFVLVGEYFARDKRPFEYLLLFPRKCTTHLFPRSTTMFIGLTWIMCTLVQLVFFLALGSTDVTTRGYPFHEQVLMFFFQTVATRTAGFNVLDMRTINRGTLIVSVFMMYMASYPFIISMRHSESTDVKKEASFGKHVRNVATSLVAYDISVVYISILCIAIAESKDLVAFPELFTVFAIVFEVVSAYGTVGLSLSLPGASFSFSGSLSSFSKLVIIVVMFLGRHRGLPSFLDSAIDVRPSVPLSHDEVSRRLKKMRKKEKDGRYYKLDKPQRDVQEIQVIVDHNAEGVEQEVTVTVPSRPSLSSVGHDDRHDGYTYETEDGRESPIHAVELVDFNSAERPRGSLEMTSTTRSRHSGEIRVSKDASREQNAVS